MFNFQVAFCLKQKTFIEVIFKNLSKPIFDRTIKVQFYFKDKYSQIQIKSDTWEKNVSESKK